MLEKDKEEKTVDQKFREIDNLFDKFSEKNHEQLSNAEIKPKISIRSKWYMCIYSSNGFRKELQLYEAICQTRSIIC